MATEKRNNFLEKYDPRIGPLRAISILGLLNRVSTLSSDTETANAMKLLNCVLHEQSAVVFFEHTKQTTFGHLAHQILMNTADNVQEMLAPYAGYMHHMFGMGRLIFDQLNSGPVHFLPVYRTDEFLRTRPKVARVMNRTDMTFKKMHAQNNVYGDLAQDLLKRPGNLVFLSPYGGTQSHEISPGIGLLFLELQRAGIPIPPLFWSAAVPKQENTTSLPDLLFPHAVRVQAETAQLPSMPENLRSGNKGKKVYLAELTRQVEILTVDRFQNLLADRD